MSHVCVCVLLLLWWCGYLNGDGSGLVPLHLSQLFPLLPENFPDVPPCPVGSERCLDDNGRRLHKVSTQILAPVLVIGKDTVTTATWIRSPIIKERTEGKSKGRKEQIREKGRDGFVSEETTPQ